MKDRNKTLELSRRNFLASAGVIGLSSVYSGPAKAFGVSGMVEEHPVLKTGPYLQALSAHAVTVRWITNFPCYSWVEYGESPQELTQKAHTVEAGLVQANNTIHAIKLDYLDPGKTYYYQVFSKVIDLSKPYDIKYSRLYKSSILPFSTPDPASDSLSFLVLNDIHDRPASFKHLFDLAGTEKQDFVFLNGDMFDYQIDEAQLVNHLLAPLSGLASIGTPFIFSRGNHETRGQFARQIGAYFNGFDDKFYYSFELGPMYCIVLDSGEDKEDTDAGYANLSNFDDYRIEQARWLEKEIQKKSFKKAKYRVVFSHIPTHYFGPRWAHGAEHCQKVWGPILNKAKVDVLISGHTHVHGVHPAVEGKHNYAIAIGGGPNPGLRTVIKVKVDERSFSLQMLNDKGVSVGELIL
jgi:acid phosphatase type 7